MMKKPRLSFWQIWNLSFGFLGVQIGYSLQNSNPGICLPLSLKVWGYKSIFLCGS